MFFKYGVKDDLKKTYLRKHINTHLLRKGHMEIFDYISDEKTKTKR